MASARWTLICRKRPLGSETDKWKGPEAGACLACLRNSDERVRGKQEEVRWGRTSRRASRALGGLRFYSEGDESCGQF